MGVSFLECAGGMTLRRSCKAGRTHAIQPPVCPRTSSDIQSSPLVPPVPAGKARQDFENIGLPDLRVTHVKTSSEAQAEPSNEAGGRTGLDSWRAASCRDPVAQAPHT